MKNEYIYILVHPVQDGYLKIGATTRTPAERAKEITSKASTGLVGRYIVAYEFPVEDCLYIEKLVHERLKKYRVNSRKEFFYIKLFSAIKIIEKVINEVRTQKKIDFLPDNDFFWWDNLPFIWKQKLLSNINTIDLYPEKEEILEGVNLVIKYCKYDKLRKKVANLIANRDYAKHTFNWYKRLSINLKKAFNNYIPRTITKEELKQVINIKKIDCSGNSLIEDLVPISYLKEVENINFSNTSVSNLEPLKNLKKLKTASFNYTNVSSLKPIYMMERLKTIKCIQSLIDEDEVGNFKAINPNCEVLLNPFE